MAENASVEKKRRRRKSEEETEVVGKGTATPGRRNKESNDESGNFLTRPFINFYSYLTEVNNEMKKVTWPTREETIRLTWIILIATVISSLVLGALSLIADRTIAFGLDTPIIFIVIFGAFIVGTLYYFRRTGSSGRGY